MPALLALYSGFDASVGHYRRYKKRELKEKIEAAGFTLLTIRYFDLFGVLPWYVVFTLLGRVLSPGSAGA